MSAGMLGDFEAARPLSNIPLVWMLDKAAGCGLPLPVGWRGRFDCDPQAPMVGTWAGLGKLFLARRRRTVGRDRSESIHPSARAWFSDRHPARLAGEMTPPGGAL